MQPTCPQWGVWQNERSGKRRNHRSHVSMAHGQESGEETRMNTANITCYIRLSWNMSMTSGWYLADVHDTDPDKNAWSVALKTSDTKKNIDDSSGIQVERSLCLYRGSALVVSYSQKRHQSILNHILWTRMGDQGGKPYFTISSIWWIGGILFIYSFLKRWVW
jgi:hypothetical protein